MIIVAVVLLLLAASVRNIVKLELENRRLKHKQKELIEQRKELKIELRNVNSKEYIEEQARKQLRLVDPDEILFVFPNEKDKDNAKTNNLERADRLTINEAIVVEVVTISDAVAKACDALIIATHGFGITSETGG